MTHPIVVSTSAPFSLIEWTSYKPYITGYKPVIYRNIGDKIAEPVFLDLLQENRRIQLIPRETTVKREDWKVENVKKEKQLT